MSLEYLKGTGPAKVDAFDSEWLPAWEQVDDPKGKVALLTICSHAKPYSKSYIHTMIRKELHEHNLLHRVEYAHISSAGVVPAVADMDYPFCAYDWNVAEASAQDIAYHVAKTTERLRLWYEMHGRKYDDVFVYLRPSGHTMQAVLSALGWRAHIVAVTENLGDLPFVMAPDIDDCLTMPANLRQLTNEMEVIRK